MSEQFLKRVRGLFREFRFSLLFFFITIAILLSRSGRFSKNPEVEVLPDNTYERSLYVVADSNNSPYSFIDENGRAQGFDVELITLIANRLQMNLVINYLPWEDCIERITSHKADLLLSMDYAGKFQGSDSLIKTQPIVKDDLVVYSRVPVASLADLKTEKIAISSDCNMSQKTNVLVLDENCTVYENSVSTMQALLSGDADCAIIRQSVGAVLLKELKKEGKKTDVKAFLKVGETPMCLAVDGARAEYAGPINEALDIFSLDGTIDSLRDKWLTTFVRPYSFIEILENNRWIIFIVALYFAFTINAFFNNKRRWLQEKEKELIKEQKMQQQIQDALAEAQAANKAKTSFLNSMSHDIRTPMNAIMGFTELALNHLDDTELVSEYLKKAQLSSSHLLSLINAVLDMSRIESGKMTFSESEENLLSIVHSLESIVHADVLAKNQTLSVESSGVTDENIVCDKLHLNQVLLNILSNAIKYTPDGGCISLSVNQKKHRGKNSGTYLFVIKDNGIGMSREYLSTIFEPFTREETETVSCIQGTGLGMSIVKKIVDMMGGKLEIKSEPGKGTEVDISFDFEICSGKTSGESELCSENEEIAGKQTFEGKKILLVDDNDFNREITVEILSGYGFIVDTAVNGQDALQKIETASAGDYDLILMDIQMPVMDGLEATRKIRALTTENSCIPIVAMTADAFAEDRVRALDAGMNDHVSKPVDYAKLAKVMTRLFS